MYPFKILVSTKCDDVSVLAANCHDRFGRGWNEKIATECTEIQAIGAEPLRWSIDFDGWGVACFRRCLPQGFNCQPLMFFDAVPN